MTNECEELLVVLRGRWPQQWTSTPETRQALEILTEDARVGRPTSLPVVQAAGQQIGWLTLASSQRALRQYLDDAKVWLEAIDASTIGNDLTRTADAVGPLAPMLKVLAPEGYVRWNTPIARGAQLLARLARMHRFLSTQPELIHNRVPSTAALRLEFISAISVGDWALAEGCIDEIDHWNLAHAHTTLQMRIRLLEARGASAELFELASQTQAWRLTSPQRIAAAILAAVDVCALQPVESSQGIEAAYALYKDIWHPKLVHCVGDARGALGAARLLAYAAAADKDGQALAALLPHLDGDLARFFDSQLDKEAVAAVPIDITELPSPIPDLLTVSVSAGAGTFHGSTADVQPLARIPIVGNGDAGTYWSDLVAAVKSGRTTRARDLVAELSTNLLDDPDFLGAAPDAILELLSDPAIDTHPSSQVLLYEVLAELIDAFVVAPGFPRLAHRNVYVSLLEGMVTLRGETANEADSQLVLGLVGALISLSADTVDACEMIVRAWWRRRPIVQRLNWLAAALDTLAPLHADSQRLIDMYTEGLLLAARKAVTVPPTEASRWRAIGQALEMSAADIDELLLPLTQKLSVGQADPLASAGLERVAIVSLREGSAQEAAVQLRTRTGAKVFVVTSLVADQETRQALAADLILYVWAATSHATYRAFDGCRDRLEYVQGTGAASIVMAAERWVARAAP